MITFFKNSIFFFKKNKHFFIEFELVKAAFYTDPDDQSAWLYHWWLVAQGMKNLTLIFTLILF